MKAKDYFNKYKNGLASEDRDTYVLTFREMYQEMFEECIDTMRARNIKRDDAVVSVFKEMNERYNALCRLLAKEYGNSPIKENGFASLACDTCEFLTPYFSKELKSLNQEKRGYRMSRYIDEKDVYRLVEPNGTARVHCSQIDELPRADVAPKNKWISVEARLPERNGRYLTHCLIEGQSLVCVLYYCKVGGFNESTVTHWMPLPEPPKESEGAE